MLRKTSLSQSIYKFTGVHLLLNRELENGLTALQGLHLSVQCILYLWQTDLAAPKRILGWLEPKKQKRISSFTILEFKLLFIQVVYRAMMMAKMLKPI